MGKTLEVLAAVGDDLMEPEHFVKCDDPKAVEYALKHIDQVKEILLDRLAVLAVNEVDVAQVVCDFMDWLEAQGRIRCADPAAGRRALKGHAYLVRGQPQRPAVGDRALLVGDALGLAQPASGEGIAPAVESGLIAAQVVLEASGRSDEAALGPYEARLEQRFGQLHRSAKGWRRQQRIAPMRRAMASRLLRSPWFVRNVVLDRWFLHRSLPPFRTTTDPGSSQLSRLPTLSSTTTD